MIENFSLKDILRANSVIKVMIDDVKFEKIRNALVQVRNALSVYYVDRIEEDTITSTSKVKNEPKQKGDYDHDKE